MIIGCDDQPSFQQIAWVDTETGEGSERRLTHSNGEAEKFYRDLQRRGVQARVGMEATGHAGWFERLLAELHHELWVGDPAHKCADTAVLLGLVRTCEASCFRTARAATATGTPDEIHALACDRSTIAQARLREHTTNTIPCSDDDQGRSRNQRLDRRLIAACTPTAQDQAAGHAQSVSLLEDRRQSESLRLAGMASGLENQSSMSRRAYRPHR